MNANSARNGLPAVRIVHLDWNISVDFDAQALRATATYTFEREQTSRENQLLLDTNHLMIEQVSNVSDGAALPYELLPPTPGKPHLGRKLVIQFGDSAGVSVMYQTTAQCSAIQWLAPAQTAGKVHPYMFTQCQAIHARSLVPCQDVTGVKFTYTAHVTVPAWATAVMSAVCQCVNDDKNDDKTSISNSEPTKTAVWEQTVPISSYLLALAVGELERRELSDRCAVFSEPSIVEAAAYEFAETELFLQTAETIAGTPYQWGRYDLLCLPPSVCTEFRC